ncbi:hypothetical protein F5Y18DRAFT_421665 [Xylariaceae sp. FL1019]|nr:hypothetical protein F5Y18DRAFT_421665 [Xylariaceae sp. FL1019]
MISQLFILGTLTLQASASSLPIWQRDGGVSNYQGPGQLIQDLRNPRKTPSLRPRTSTLHTRAVDQDKAEQLLGADSIVDCPPNGMTSWDSAVDAATLFVNSLGASPMTLQPGICYHQEASNTLAQVCNKGTTPLQITAEGAQIGFDVIEETCTSQKSSGTIRTSTGLRYAIHAKVPVRSRSLDKRASKRPVKRCLDSSTQEVTGCEDVVCTPAISLNESGDCPNVGNDETDGCSYYCEIKAAKYYGVPEVYDDTRYCAGNDCYLEEGESFTVEKSLSVSFGLEGEGPIESVLSAGISFGIAVSESTSLTQGFNFGEGACGYWYKAPVMLHSCGTLSEYEPNFSGDAGPLYCLSDAPFSKSTPNVCSEIQATSINSDDADVVVIPRWVNCGDRTDLPDDENSDAWKDTYAGQNDEVHSC